VKKPQEHRMKTKIIIRTVVLFATIAMLASGCDFMQSGGGSSGPQFQMSKLTVTTQGKGLVTQVPAALSGGQYPKGTTVQLRAAGNMRNSLWTFIMALMFANSGAVDGLNVTLFNNWTGDLAGATNPAAIVLDTSKTIQAVFVRQGVTTITTPGGATVANSNAPPAYAELIYSAGRLLHANYYATSAPSGQFLATSYTYNSLGQCTVAKATDPTGVTTLCTTSYTYTASGDVSTEILQYPSYAQNVQFTYDTLGRVAAMTMNMTGSGTYTQEVYCSYGDNGILMQMDVYVNGVYSYYLATTDANGNVTKLAGYNQDGTPNPGSNISLAYDANSLITQATLPMGSSYVCTLGWAPL
jgi:hypothetical protein